MKPTMKPKFDKNLFSELKGKNVLLKAVDVKPIKGKIVSTVEQLGQKTNREHVAHTLVLETHKGGIVIVSNKIESISEICPFLDMNDNCMAMGNPHADVCLYLHDHKVLTNYRVCLDFRLATDRAATLAELKRKHGIEK